MSDRLTPIPEDKFAFGLWTIGHPGRDPFGDSTRPPVSTADFLRGLADIGAWGVSFHDDDLMTFGAPEAQRRAELDAFKKVLDEIILTNLVDYEVIGTFENSLNAYPSELKDGNCFVIKRIK
jgi:hypothetical protein